MTIKNKTLFWFLLPSIIIAAVTAVFCYFFTKKIVTQNIFNQLEVAADELQSHIHSFLREKKGQVLNFSSDGFIRDCTEEITEKEERKVYYTIALNNHLVTNKKSLHPGIIEVFVVDFKGEVIASTDKTRIGEDVSTEEYFTKVEYPGAFAGEPHYDTYLNEIVIDFSTILLSKVDFPLPRLPKISSCCKGSSVFLLIRELVIFLNSLSLIIKLFFKSPQEE